MVADASQLAACSWRAGGVAQAHRGRRLSSASWSPSSTVRWGESQCWQWELFSAGRERRVLHAHLRSLATMQSVIGSRF